VWMKPAQRSQTNITFPARVMRTCPSNVITIQSQTNCTVNGSFGVATMIPGNLQFGSVTSVTTLGGGTVALDLRSGAVVVVDAANPPRVFVTETGDTLQAVMAVRTVVMLLALLLGVSLFVSYKLGRKP